MDKLLHRPPVDRFQAMERSLCLGDLDLGGGEALLLGVFLDPSTEEGLAASVVAPDRLEHGAALGDVGQFLGDHRLEPIQPDGEEVQAPLRDGPLAQCGDDLSAAFSADFHGSIQVELPFELRHVEFDLVLVAVERQDLVTVHVQQPLDAGDEPVQSGGGDTRRHSRRRQAS